MVEMPLSRGAGEPADGLEATRLTGRPLGPARSARQTRIEWNLRQLVREGRIGTPTHVSCIDRRADPARSDGATNVDYAQVLALGADDLNRLRNILGRDPIRILARCTRAAWSTYRHGSTTEAFVEMTGGLHIHYYGSLTSNRSEHALWLEGDRGVLWTDRSLIWWRKRGWPVFVPLRSRSVPGGERSAGSTEEAGRALERFRAAVQAGQSPSSTDHELWTLAIVEAAIRSDRTRTTVAVSDLFQTAGADPGVTLSGRNVT
jgi:predicted dehydrogenase